VLQAVQRPVQTPVQQTVCTQRTVMRVDHALTIKRRIASGG
jgi:uncharacterized protein